MNKPALKSLATCVVFLLLFNLSSYGYFWSLEWEDISQADLDMKEPKIDPDAAIEYLQVDVTLDDAYYNSVNGYGQADAFEREARAYYKLKVFDKRGVDDLDVIDIPYHQDSRIKHFLCRITYPDGTETFLNESDLYQRSVLKYGDVEVFVKSFSLPKLEVGCIVEYKHKRTSDYLTWGLILEIAKDYPVHKAKFEIRPFEEKAKSLSKVNLEKEIKLNFENHYVFELDNIPGSKPEVYSVPPKDYEPWVYVAYHATYSRSVDGYWKIRAKEIGKDSGRYITPKNGKVKEVAARIFAGITDPQEKLKKAYEYATKEIRSKWRVTGGYSDAEREELEDNDFPYQTISRGYGNRADIRNVFASLAGAAGFEVCLAHVADRTDMHFRYALGGEASLPDEIVAVKVNDEWKFFDPGTSYLPFGWLDDANQGAAVLLGIKSKKPVFLKTPSASAEESKSIRKAKLKLNEGGDLSGTVAIEYTGHLGLKWKYIYDERSVEDQEEYFLERLNETLGRAEISNFEVLNETSWDENVVVKFDISIPAYAESLGSRMFLEPSVFEAGKSPVFKEEIREQDIMYFYKYTEEDTVTISLPEGYKPEDPASPGAPIKSAAFGYKSSIGLNKSKTKLRLQRTYYVNTLEIEKKHYAGLKGLFAEISRRDSNTLSLKKEESIDEE